MNGPSSKQIRRVILEQSKRAHVGHIGSGLSIADLLSALYSGILRVASPEDPNRDRFILSKGHAVLSLYAVLFLKGWMTEAQLNTYCADGTLLAVHPEHKLRGIEYTTGSLGQGLSMGAGAALAARLAHADWKTIVLLSDAECNEGSVWEAAMFAAHHRLSHLTAILDLNGQQALGYTCDVLDLSPMKQRWEAFGWEVAEVDGHDVSAIQKALSGFRKDAPHLLIARTTFGKGVSFMENKIKWHYWPMSDEDYQKALKDIEAMP